MIYIFIICLLKMKELEPLFIKSFILDREVVSTKLKNAQQYGKNFYEKKLILDILAIDDVGDLYNTNYKLMV